jgi:hypothetical protein
MFTAKLAGLPTNRIAPMKNTTGAPAKSVPRNKEKLIAATLASQTAMRVSFADGRTFSLAIADLGLPVDQIRWETATVAGAAMSVKTIDAESIPIDSSSIRYIVDSAYAREIDTSIASLLIPQRELQELLPTSEPPEEWYRKGEENHFD